MANYTITLPKPLLKTIRDLGYDPESYIQTLLIAPLLEQYRAQLKEKYLLKHTDDIEAEVEQSRSVTILKSG